MVRVWLCGSQQTMLDSSRLRCIYAHGSGLRLLASSPASRSTRNQTVNVEKICNRLQRLSPAACGYDQVLVGIRGESFQCSGSRTNDRSSSPLLGRLLSNTTKSTLEALNLRIRWAHPILSAWMLSGAVPVHRPLFWNRSILRKAVPGQCGLQPILVAV